ncbi:BPSS1780 family membrane protein [Halochromatium glycolicum]|uniref:Uncharacterized protein n=1 Tax=Halochromatium glycolicum TaxID=85075 RepID=A0AAJ0U1K1_9GAMM|nr:BPSS1780 family membrane protein [Halochromatium glycolicum]MBK1703574.1 hypothetical protein [Halochromatium glycolicum]
MSHSFQVVFTGRLSAAAQIDDAVRDFASVFKVDEAKARSLIGAGQERVLKADVDEQVARRYLDVLGEIGLEARLEQMEGSPPEDSPPEGSSPSEAGGDGDLQPVLAETASTPSSAPPPPPPSDPAATSGLSLTAGPVARPASHGWDWIKQAWGQFKQQPRGWLLAVALVYLVTLALSMVPVVGSLATMILGPVFAGGLMLGAQTQQRGGTLRVSAGFDGFSRHGGQLALVGVLYFVGLILVFIIAGVLGFTLGGLSAGSLETLNTGDPEAMAAMGPGLALLILFATLLFVPLLMAYWFAPALVALDGVPALDAMRMSFRGCWKNIVPFIVYGLTLFFILVGFSVLFGLLTAILSGLGETLAIVAMLLLVPLMLVFAVVVVLSIYSGYRDVFHREEPVSGRLAL